MTGKLSKLISNTRLTGIQVITRVIDVPKPITLIGSESALKLCTTISHFFAKRLLIVTDPQLIELGLIDPIIEELHRNNIHTSIFSDVVPDPDFTVVDKGIATFKQTQSDSILAIGGGSSIDVAKVVAAAVANNKAPTKLVGILRVRKPLCPFFVIPTTAGTGSEVTVGAVISDVKEHKKTLIIDPKLVPLATALDPTLMTGLPTAITAATGLDALTHGVEAYLSRFSTRETDFYASAAIKLVFQHLPAVCEQGDNLEGREALALASYYAGLALNKAGLGYVHAIAHQLGAIYQLPHGESNAIVLPYVLDMMKKNGSKKLTQLATIPQSNNGRNGDFIDQVKALINAVGLRSHYADLETKDMPEIINSAFKEAHGVYAVPKYFNYRQMEEILLNIAGGHI